MTRKMKDSGIEWIGEIPEDWKTVRVKNLFDVSRGRVISKLETTDDGKYPVYSSQTENDGIFGYIDTFDYSGEALTWTTDGEKAGTVFYRNGKYNCTNICGILQKKQDSIYKTDIKYLFYAIRMVAEENKRPDTNGHKIMSNEMERLSIPITNYDEQVKIGLTLDEKSRNIDNTLSLIKEEIESLENYKKSVITEAVTKGLDKNVEMKDSGIEWIGEIPKHWNLITIKYIAKKITDGAHIAPDTSDEIYNFVSVVDIDNNGNIDFENCLKITEAQYKYLKRNGCKVNIDDILISKDGTVGKTVYINANDEFVVASSLVIIRPNLLQAIPKFIKYALDSNLVSEQLNSLVSGSALKRISVYKNSNLKIVFTADKKDQAMIVDYLDNKTKLINDAISAKQKQLETLEEYKKSLIYEYVTGKKEVKDGEET